MVDLDELNNIEINFIVGHPRSGTTLMMVIFNQYDNCISTPEIHHFIYFYKKYRSVREVSVRLISDYKEYLKMFFHYKNSPLIGPYNSKLLDDLQPGQKISYSQLTKLVYLCLYGEKGLNGNIQVIVDKNPYYSFHIDKIFEVFPKAKIIAAVRDYRAYLLSIRQSSHTFVSQKSFLYFAVSWNAYIKMILKAKENNSGSITILKYESLVHNKEEEVRKSVEFLGLKYDSNLFDFHLYVQERMRSFEMPKTVHDRLIKKMNDLSMPINPNRVFAWRDSLTLEQRKQAEIICGEWGVKLGYKTETTYNLIDRLFVKFSALFYYIRVGMFLWINSPDIFFYNEFKVTKKRKALEESVKRNRLAE
ncbi:MAG: Sulfotransferase domain protein [Bacteroidetes bacterium]|jgi:hypothetical protein|nr:Sulfotransferase domain protein [Bacteroidota bacterium]